MGSLTEKILNEIKGYNDFTSVDEFKKYYHLHNTNESTNNDYERYEFFNENSSSSKSKLKKSEENAKIKGDEKNFLDDDIEVIYSKFEGKYENIFENIIVFTNNKDKDKNKTLNNIYEAIDNLKKAKCKIIPTLYVFDCFESTTEEEGNKIIISDNDTEIALTDDINNSNTLVFSRLSVKDDKNCLHIVNLLQDRGFLVLNPTKYTEIACNKYDTAMLLKNGDIPQPNFCSMTKDILYDEECFIDAMQKIYPNWNAKNQDKNKDFEFVVKILDGHGGTGVFLTTGKHLIAILQTIFAIDPEVSLIMQKKEEADGGDIRVHVLTLRNKQVILGAMKRVKIKSDFRSNVSLGASAEPVKLTPEQEQIALKTARISKLPWCAVDIMPLVKGSNKEVGDNVVLEINASPGTDGISYVLDYNFINILLNELTDVLEFKLQTKLAGYKESIIINFDNDPQKVLATLDTGNGSVASHIEVKDLKEEKNFVSFEFLGKKYKCEKIGTSTSHVGNETITRPIINLKSIQLGPRKLLNVPIAVVANRNKSTNCLINRDVLTWLGIAVDASLCHILTPEMEKINII